MPAGTQLSQQDRLGIRAAFTNPTVAANVLSYMDAIDTLTRTEMNYIDGITAIGTAQASKALVFDANKMIDQILFSRATAQAAIRVGTSADTHGSGATLSSSNTGIIRSYADDGNASIGSSVRNIQARTLLDATQAGGTIRSLQGQLKLVASVNVGTGIYTAVQGYVELMGNHSVSTAATLSCYDASLEIASTFTLTVDSGGEACGIHVETTGAGTITNNGTCAAILIKNASGAPDWPVGLSVDGASVSCGISIGKFASSYATGSAVVMGTTHTAAVAVFGETVADLTSAYKTRCIRGRHLVVTSSGTIKQETYGVEGQLCVKGTTLGHLHSGLLGTFEASTSVTITNAHSGYALGHAAVIARVGGGAANITATSPLSGFLAFRLDGTLASGSAYAYSAYAHAGWDAWHVGLYLSGCTTGVQIAGTCTTGIVIGDCTTGIDFAGTYIGNAIDFSNATIDPSGSDGPCFIRMGAYGTEIDYGADNHQSGAIRIYTTCSGDISSYDRGVFVCTVTTGAKAAFPVAGLAEANNTGTGPKSLQAAQFIAHLGARSSGAHLAPCDNIAGGSTNGMYAAWLKVGGNANSVCEADSRVAAAWIDNQMNGTMSGQEYGIFASTGGSRPDGFIGFETTSSGYNQFIYCDETFNSGGGTCFETEAVPTNATDARIKVWYDAKQYYIKLHR